MLQSNTESYPLPVMARNVINRSISWQPDVYELMEERRSKLRFSRSEYINRLILADIAKSGAMQVAELPAKLQAKKPKG